MSKLKHCMNNDCERYKKAIGDIKEIVFPTNQLIITDSPIICKIQNIIKEINCDNI